MSEGDWQHNLQANVLSHLPPQFLHIGYTQFQKCTPVFPATHSKNYNIPRLIFPTNWPASQFETSHLRSYYNY